MNKHIAYNFVLIFIIIKCVESQDNNPDQPADDEDEDDNFEVLDLEQIIQERISRFEDPRYQPQYQQIQESQYQPQYYDLDQGEYQYYQPELLEYDPYKQYQVQTQEQLEEPQHQHYEPPTTQTEVTQPHQPQPEPETLEDDENFYVTEHDQVYPQQEPEPSEEQPQQSQQPQQNIQYITPPQEQVAQEPIQPQKKPTKRPQTPSGYEEGEKQKPKRGRLFKSYKKSKHINFIKKNADGNLVEMTEEDYDVIHSDSTKSKYVFNANLEQLDCRGLTIYQHSDGTPYSSLLNHSKETDVFVLSTSDGFTLVKRVKGEWKRTDHKNPDHVKLYTQDEEGNEVLMTNKDYIVDLNSFGSYAYRFFPGVKCTKIIVKNMVAWEKTDEDDGFPEFINVSIELTVMVKFEKYTRTYGKRLKKYQHVYTRLNYRKT